MPQVPDSKPYPPSPYGQVTLKAQVPIRLPKLSSNEDDPHLAG